MAERVPPAITAVRNRAITDELLEVGVTESDPGGGLTTIEGFSFIEQVEDHDPGPLPGS